MQMKEQTANLKTYVTKYTTKSNKPPPKKIKPGLVTAYDLQPGNGEGLF